MSKKKELLAQPEQTGLDSISNATPMAVMPNGVCVSNVYDAYEEGRKSLMSEQQPEAWIIVNKETGYRTQVSDLTPFLYNREIFEVIPLYTAPQKREPLSEDKLDVLAEANITDEGIAGYYLGFRDAEKYHGIGGGE
jgi:hypothetical protein